MKKLYVIAVLCGAFALSMLLLQGTKINLTGRTMSDLTESERRLMITPENEMRRENERKLMEQQQRSNMSDAEKLWDEIGDKLANGHYPSDELLAQFNEKLKAGNEDLINRPYGGEDTVYGSSTLLFRATMIILNTWQHKLLVDETFDTLPWVNQHLNRVVDMLYDYGARLTEQEKDRLGWFYGSLNRHIKGMNNDLVSTEFAVLAQLLERIGIDVNLPKYHEEPKFHEYDRE